MARNPKSLTIDYKTIMAIPMNARQKMVQQGQLDPLAVALTPGQRAALFPDYYKWDLNKMAGQKSEFGTTSSTTTSGNPSSITSGYKTRVKNNSTNNKPVEPVKKGISPGDFRRIEANPMLAGYADSIGKQNVSPQNDFKGFTGKEKAVIKMIAKREGSTDPNIIFGDVGNKGGTGKYSKALGLDNKKLSDMTINEVIDLQGKLRQLTKADGIGVIDGRVVGTSAVGMGQMIEGTLKSNLQKLGIPEDQWDKVKFDGHLQNRLTLQNFRDNVGDPNDPNSWNMTGLQNQWESFDTRKGKAPLSQTEIESVQSETSELVEKTNNATPVKFNQVQSADELAAIIPDDASINTIPTATPVVAKVTGDKLKPIDDPLAYMNSRNPRGADIDEVDPVLLKSYSEGIQQFEKNNPDYEVQVFGPASGVRSRGSTHNHGIQPNGYGGAIDLVIVDKKTGQQLTNFNRSYPGQIGSPGETAPLYAELHSAARLAQAHYFPDSNKITFGGGFVSGDTRLDLMHGDLTHRGDMSGFNFETGYSDQQMKTYGIKNNVSIGNNTQELASQIYGQVDDKGNYVNRAITTTDKDGNKTYASAKVVEPQNSTVAEVKKPVIQGAQELAKPVDELAKESAIEDQTGINREAAVGVMPSGPVFTDPVKPTATPTSSMASGGLLDEPHTAINNRTGEMVNLGEKGTGGEYIVPRNKINAKDLEEKEVPQQKLLSKPIVASADATQKTVQPQSKMTTSIIRNTTQPIPTMHQKVPETLRKAYNRATMNEDAFSPGFGYYKL